MHRAPVVPKFRVSSPDIKRHVLVRQLDLDLVHKGFFRLRELVMDDIQCDYGYIFSVR